MTVEQPGLCLFCRGKLGLVRRLNKQRFCSDQHEAEFHRLNRDLGLACLKEFAGLAHDARPALEMAEAAGGAAGAKR